MRSKLVLEIVLVVLVFALFVQCREVKATGLTTDPPNVLDPNGAALVTSSNIQSVDEPLSNVTLHTFPSFMPKFPIDYSSGPQDLSASDVMGMYNSVSPVPSSTIQAVEECLSNVTLSTYPDFKPELSIGYSSGSSDSASSDVMGTTNSVISAVPVFPSIVVVLFVGTVLGVIVLKTKRFI